MPICDRCNTPLSVGDGYCVYSEARQGISFDVGGYINTGSDTGGLELGALILCEACADGLFTEEVWAHASDVETKMAIERAYEETTRLQRVQAINYSVAMRAKRSGLGVSEARQEAREIAILWWSDNDAGVRRLVNTPPPHETKKWFEYWK